MDHFFVHRWDDLLGRAGGPLTFRLVIQPAMAIALGLRAGLRDARAGRTPFGSALLQQRAARHELVRHGWTDVGKVFAIALILDLIYQVIALRWIYPTETLIVAFALAIVPYALVRGPAARFVRRMKPRPPADKEKSQRRGARRAFGDAWRAIQICRRYRAARLTSTRFPCGAWGKRLL